MSEDTTCDTLFCVMSRGHHGRHVDQDGKFFGAIEDTQTGTAPDNRRANRPAVKGHHGKRAPYIDYASEAMSSRAGLEATNTGSLYTPDAAHLCIQNGMLFGTGNRLMWACRVMRRLAHNGGLR